jgi:predicted nucleic acid-binding protein
MRNRVICDSSSLISMSMNCMLPVVTELSENADFIITPTVYDEIITNPQRAGHHRMGPLQFKALCDNGILKTEKPDNAEVQAILDLSNNIYYAKHRSLNIIQRGEAEALSLANGGDVLLMDERTLRYMIESPRDLLGLLQHRMRRGITMKRERREAFEKYCKGVSIIRSSEILAVAYEKGILEKYFSGPKREIIEASLWALKLKGCSLSNEDIDEYLKMLG